MTDTCWYCDKELVEPTKSYTRKHRKAKMVKEITVHEDCYKRIRIVRNKYRPRASGSVSQ